ncbi:MAG: acyl-CoA synthetase, partial [Pseudomonadota bacterium]
MADGQELPPFRPIAQKRPDIECIRKPDGTVYLSQRHQPGDRPRTIPHALATRAEMHPDRPWLKQR